jgi:excinuclease UvrABC ATPase subunit
MLRKIAFPVLFAAVVYLVPNANNAQDKKHSFEGTTVCGTCHKTEKQGQQLKIWQESKHANAFKTLQTEEADKIAKEKGLAGKASESKECLECHVSGHDVDKALLGAKFKMEDGVQCETCHGPGSDYKPLKIMKDKAASVANGLIVWADEAAIEANCKTCHNEKSPTYKAFDFKTMYSKIKHNVPKS